jgi:o-succinylbenzoate synthase
MVNTCPVTFEYIKRTLIFRFDAGTSRGVLKTKEVYWIKAFQPENLLIPGWGEAAPLVNLSVDDRVDFEKVLAKTLARLSKVSWLSGEENILEQVNKEVSSDLPSIRFGVEIALLDLNSGGLKKFFTNSFYDQLKPISINGLIWMGDEQFMLSQIEAKLAQGFDCIKMKIGAIDFELELKLLRSIRERYSKEEITLRVDANGAFSPSNAISKLELLAKLDLHSIEQPIASGQMEEMKRLCAISPLDIALDEELIGVEDKAALLDQINPPYIILKPTLVGGVLQTKEWISLAEERNIGWWMTSALESNIGLNAIAQLTSSYSPLIPQGLGTGQLYTNNLASPLEIVDGTLVYNLSKQWESPA